MMLLTTFPGCGLGHSWVSVIMFEENCSQQQSCSTHRCVFQCMSPQSGKFITAKATFIEKQWGFGPSFGLHSWMISFWGLSGASAGSTLNSVAKTHSSICLLFTSLTMSLNTLIIFTHSPAHSSVREGLHFPQPYFTSRWFHVWKQGAEKPVGALQLQVQPSEYLECPLWMPDHTAACCHWVPYWFSSSPWSAWLHSTVFKNSWACFHNSATPLRW